jgi:hypothetical protein
MGEMAEQAEVMQASNMTPAQKEAVLRKTIKNLKAANAPGMHRLAMQADGAVAGYTDGPVTDAEYSLFLQRAISDKRLAAQTRAQAVAL